MRILIAEDEKSLNKILSSRLTEEHYSVDSCHDGEEALDYIEGAEYDAVILDIMMPKKDGLTVLKTCLLYTSIATIPSSIGESEIPSIILPFKI